MPSLATKHLPKRDNSSPKQTKYIKNIILFYTIIKKKYCIYIYNNNIINKITIVILINVIIVCLGLNNYLHFFKDKVYLTKLSILYFIYIII
jgi:hypothetical protein